MVIISHRGIVLAIAVAATTMTAAYFDKLTPAQQYALSGAANDCSTAAASEAERADACNAILTTTPYAEVSNPDLVALKGLMLDFEMCVKSKILQKARSTIGNVAPVPAKKRESRQAEANRKITAVAEAANDNIIHGPPDFWQLSVKLSNFACSQDFLEGSVVTSQYCDMVLSQRRASVSDESQRNTTCDKALAQIPDVLKEIMRRFPWRAWRADAKNQAGMPELAPKSPIGQQTQPKSNATLPPGQTQPSATTSENSAPGPADSAGNTKPAIAQETQLKPNWTLPSSQTKPPPISKLNDAPAPTESVQTNSLPVGQKEPPQEVLPQPKGSSTNKTPSRPSPLVPAVDGIKGSTESRQPDAIPALGQANPKTLNNKALPQPEGASRLNVTPTPAANQSKHKIVASPQASPSFAEPAPPTLASEIARKPPNQLKSPASQPEATPSSPALAQKPQASAKGTSPSTLAPAKQTPPGNTAAKTSDLTRDDDEEASEQQQQQQDEPQPDKQPNRPLPPAPVPDANKDTIEVPKPESSPKTPQGQPALKPLPVQSVSAAATQPDIKPLSAVAEAAGKQPPMAAGGRPPPETGRPTSNSKMPQGKNSPETSMPPSPDDKPISGTEPDKQKPTAPPPARPQPQNTPVSPTESLPPNSGNDVLSLQRGPTNPGKHKPPLEPVQQAQQNYTTAPEHGAVQLNETFNEEEAVIRLIVKDAVLKTCTLNLIEGVIKKYFCDAIYYWVSTSAFIAAVPLLLAIDTFVPGTHSYFLHAVKAVFCVRQELKTGLADLRQKFAASKKPTVETDKLLTELTADSTHGAQDDVHGAHDQGFSLNKMLTKWAPPGVNVTRVLKAVDDLGIGGRHGLGEFAELVSLIPGVHKIPGAHKIIELAVGYSESAHETNTTHGHGHARNDTKKSWAAKYGSKFVKAGVFIVNAKNKGCDLMWKPIQKAGKKVWDLKVSDVWDRVKESRTTQKALDKVSDGATKSVERWRKLKADVKRTFGKGETGRNGSGSDISEPSKAEPATLKAEPDRPDPHNH